MAGALIFDFDGIILDTESADYESWRALYAEWNAELPRERWLASIGTDTSSFHPLDHLLELIEGALGEDELRRRRQHHLDAWQGQLRPLPGVVHWIEQARELGLAVGIASSSPSAWVDKYLKHAELEHAFDTVVTADRVSRVKPSPDLYLEALGDLAASAEESLALEDSPHGVAAAKAAGLYCIAVPGPMTRELDLSAADLRLQSLSDRGLASVLR